MLCVYLCISSLFVLGGLCLEPMCSKFAYDEQLLEKMIRMEFTTEKKEEQNIADKEKLMQAIDELKTEIQDMKTDKEEMMQSLAELKTEIQDLKADNEDAGSEVDEMGLTVKRTKVVAFSANTAKNTNPSKGETIQFKVVTLNEGEGYNSSTGIFTTPVEGLYIFHDQMCVKEQKDFYHAFVVDTTEMTKERYYNADPKWPMCYTAVFSGHLKVGQEVHVRCRYIHKNGTRLIDNGSRLNMFSGILVTEILNLA